MFVSYPCESATVANRVQAAQKASNNMPVFVMEWNYPVLANSSQNSSFPSVANFSGVNQMACMRETYAAVKAVGGLGIMYFKFAEAEGIVVPPGGNRTLVYFFFIEKKKRIFEP